jgi:hypothetical protein
LILPRPKHASAWVKQCGIKEITMRVVETGELHPPKGVQAARWVLLTAEPVDSFPAAWTILEHYEKRPLVEDWHKALRIWPAITSRFQPDWGMAR